MDSSNSSNSTKLTKNFNVQSWLNILHFASVCQELNRLNYNVSSKSDVISILVSQAYDACPQKFSDTEAAIDYLESIGLFKLKPSARSAPKLIKSLVAKPKADIESTLGDILAEVEEKEKEK